MRRAACILSIFVISACARGPAPSTAVAGVGELRHAELLGSGRAHSTLYEAIRALRPLFLQARPTAALLSGTPPRLRVFIDGVDAGDADVLHQLRADQVESVRRLQPSQVFVRLGATRTADGVLDVTLRKY